MNVSNNGLNRFNNNRSNNNNRFNSNRFDNNNRFNNNRLSNNNDSRNTGTNGITIPFNCENDEPTIRNSLRQQKEQQQQQQQPLNLEETIQNQLVVECSVNQESRYRGCYILCEIVGLCNAGKDNVIVSSINQVEIPTFESINAHSLVYNDQEPISNVELYKVYLAYHKDLLYRASIVHISNKLILGYLFDFDRIATINENGIFKCRTIIFY
ncbi:hypothetical protein ACTA71_000097 [Dictyostelium dimigraforme]